MNEASQIDSAARILLVADPASPDSSSVLEVLQSVRRVTGVEVPHRVVARRPGDVAASFADPRRANLELGWEATHDLEEAVRDAWRWQSRYPDGYRTPAPGGV